MKILRVIPICILIPSSKLPITSTFIANCRTYEIYCSVHYCSATMQHHSRIPSLSVSKQAKVNNAVKKYPAEKFR